MQRIGSVLAACLLAGVCVAAEPAGPAAPAAAASVDGDEAALRAHVDQAWDLIRAHRAREALGTHLEPVIAHYTAAYASSPKRVYAASSPAESLYYLGMAAAAHDAGAPARDTIVIGPTWADAYMAKGYAHVELREAAAAEAALRAAVGLSPSNTQYLAELAFVVQQRGASEEALAIFAQSEEAAGLLTDEGAQQRARGRACRGQGYALIELGRLDDAERQYHACLEIDPKDDKSLHELEYIGTQRQRAGGKP